MAAAILSRLVSLFAIMKTLIAALCVCVTLFATGCKRKTEKRWYISELPSGQFSTYTSNAIPIDIDERGRWTVVGAYASPRIFELIVTSKTDRVVLLRCAKGAPSTNVSALVQTCLDLNVTNMTVIVTDKSGKELRTHWKRE